MYSLAHYHFCNPQEPLNCSLQSMAVQQWIATAAAAVSVGRRAISTSTTSCPIAAAATMAAAAGFRSAYSSAYRCTAATMFALLLLLQPRWVHRQHLQQPQPPLGRTALPLGMLQWSTECQLRARAL